MQLGQGPVEISRVVLGCMWSARLTEAEIARVVHAACDAGITAFDTAPLYGFHGSEAVLGRALRDRRDRVQLLTKAGLRWDDRHGEILFEFRDATGTQRAVRKDSRPEQLVAEVEASLRRLGTDVIDLLQIHHPDPFTPLADSLGALTRLVEAGKVRALGVSNFSPAQLTETITRLAPSAPLAALQCEYNLLQRWPEAELLPLCRARRVGVLAYSPLAKGLLAARPAEARAKRPRASDDSFYGHPLARPLIARAVQDALVPLAREKGADADQIALAWLLATGSNHAVVVGASSEAQAQRNGRAQAIALSPAEVAAVRRRFARLDLPLRALSRGLKLPGVTRVDRLARRVLRKLR